MEMTTVEISFVVPCYNEAPDVLSQTLRQLRESLRARPDVVYEIIVVNDGSTQYSYADLDVPDVCVLTHERNCGYGRSLMTGIHRAKYDWIGIADADATYPVERMPELIAQAQGRDMVVGSRPWRQLPLLRRPAKWVINRLAAYIAGTPIPDLNSGMRVFRKEIVTAHERTFPSGFSFTTTLTMICLTNFHPVRFVEIPYRRRAGKSKIRPVQDTLLFFSQILRLALYFRPLRFFMPLTAVLLVLAMARGMRDVLVVNHLGGLALVLFFMAFQVFFFGLIAEIINKK
jgi:glycosyltransferase involved in cell wall biosynthesis